MRVPEAEISPERLRDRLDATPALAAVAEGCGEVAPYLVGGGVRDLVLGHGRADLDVAVEAPSGAVVELARRIDPDARVHDRFGTATVRIAGGSVDLAATRAESYRHPGALPDVRPAPLADDLARRDFTINAMAIPLAGEPRLIDPHGGLEDLRAGILRALHEGSFVDDPTRALRAARYAARLGLEPETATAAWLRGSDLGTVSAERVEAELRRLAAEPDPAAALRLLVDWGLVEADEALAAASLRVLAGAGWGGIADPAAAFLAAGAVRGGRFGPLEGGQGGRELAMVEGSRPSELVAAARGRSGVELVIARVLGADWLDRYLADWRAVRLEINGADLLAAGVPEGPAIGRGLATALARKLDGEIGGRERELAAAVEAARDDE
jgi:tRNA nucleotidyltransferase (CCA-adding enzyme)